MEKTDQLTLIFRLQTTAIFAIFGAELSYISKKIGEILY